MDWSKVFQNPSRSYFSLEITKSFICNKSMIHSFYDAVLVPQDYHLEKK